MLENSPSSTQIDTTEGQRADIGPRREKRLRISASGGPEKDPKIAILMLFRPQMTHYFYYSTRT